jgi:hypothetical protein
VAAQQALNQATAHCLRAQPDHEVARAGVGGERQSGEARGLLLEHAGAPPPRRTVMAPDPFVAPFFNFLLDRTSKERKGDEQFRSWRTDEYPD